jgi:hypothetical protein
MVAMSLIECAECNRQVSSLATACPGCGWPVPDTASSVSEEEQAPSDKAKESKHHGDSRGSPATATTKPVSFLPGSNVWLYLMALVVVALIGWRLQRRYLPTCGQVASHAHDVFVEADPKSAEHEGEIRQTCIDQDWTMSEKRTIMGADTVSQVWAAKPRRGSWSSGPGQTAEDDELPKPLVYGGLIAALALGLVIARHKRLL